MADLYSYNKESGHQSFLLSGSLAYCRSQMNQRVQAYGKKGPQYLLYDDTGNLHSSTVSGGANPNTWGAERDARKRGRGRKNINV